MKKILLAVVILSASAFGQTVIGNGLWQFVWSAPSGACNASAQPQLVIGPGTVYTCQSATWTLASSSGGGSGTVSACAAAGNSYYSGAGSTVVCDTNITDNGSGTLTIPTAAVTTFSGNPNFTGTPTFANTLALNTSGSSGTVNTNTYPAAAGFTSGGVPFFSSTTAEGSSGLLAANSFVLGGGSGAAPLTSVDFTISAGQVVAGSVSGNAGSFKAQGTTSGSVAWNCNPTTTCSGWTTTAAVTAGKFTGGTAGTTVGFVDLSAGDTTAAMTVQSSATCTNVTGMVWSLTASKNYDLRCQIPRTLAASATLSYCLNGPGTPTSYSLDVQGANGSAGAWSDLNTLAQTSWQVKTTASAAAANTSVDYIYGFIQNGSTASGTSLTLQTAANGTNNITVLANASCTLTQVN